MQGRQGNLPQGPVLGWLRFEPPVKRTVCCPRHKGDTYSGFIKKSKAEGGWAAPGSSTSTKSSQTKGHSLAVAEGRTLTGNQAGSARGAVSWGQSCFLSWDLGYQLSPFSLVFCDFIYLF